jgi:gluconokinase
MTTRGTVVLLMGVSGSGKSTVGAGLAERLGWTYAEADDFHPPANIEKMSAGLSLNDEDRAPWLAGIGAWIDSKASSGRSAVVTCSGLKRRYRDFLAGGRPQVRLALLDCDRDVLERRMAARSEHFFPAQLLDSQLRDLELPQRDERVLTVRADQPPDVIVDAIVYGLRLDKAADPRQERETLSP